MGALDSACNRTVTGPQWLISYLEALREAPGEIWSLVDSMPEREVFRFGDGSTQVSAEVATTHGHREHPHGLLDFSGSCTFIGPSPWPGLLGIGGRP